MVTDSEGFVAALCDGLETCCATQAFSFDRTGCETRARITVAAREPDHENWVLDTNALSECANEARQAIGACLPTPDEGACERVFTGTLATNEACIESTECAPVTGAEVYCSSVCRVRTRAAAGEPCQATCREFTCDFLGEAGVEQAACYLADGLACVDGTCGSPPVAGQACAGTICGDGARCGTDGICVALGQIGEACTSNSCVDTAFCDGGTCAALLPVGGICGGDDDCESGYCVQGDIDATCVAVEAPQEWSELACAGSVMF